VFTFIAALEGVITPICALFYVSAQCVGSIVAYLVIKSVMDTNTEEKYSLGGCMIDGNGEGISPTNAFILEFSCTFIVLFVGVTASFDKRRCKELGLQMVCGILAGAMALAFLGPSLLKGSRLWYGHWVFWVGPFVACIVYYGFTLTLPTGTS
jgi:glycerol uptake facilitator-like aquaporin